MFTKASELSYRALRRLLYSNFRLNNELEIEGIENIPQEGGVLLASNHQSWMDVQVLGAACPRRVHFIAKSEFQTWPVLRHLIKLSESVFGFPYREHLIHLAVEAVRSARSRAKRTSPAAPSSTRQACCPGTPASRAWR